ncbi:hypothetical protein B0T25DRAFT_552763 [Lasiosphaeria hispida]|uniref:Uncharacterized protein n=1 Tax=Lasiosphaeria hispida TaxID=260671 RepID=A0AAJ0HBU1_9PEZI|nr:hypothetical protein B0T25DRAFT_552763 [Lasiosphaeria hispida]
MSQSTRMAPIDSPRSQHLQAQAREAVKMDPLLAGHNTRSPQGPLPSLAPHHSQHGVRPNATPPLRALSASPPRSSHSDSKGPLPPNAASTKASLSALLLHPSPSNSEPGSANPGSANSANSSPRTQHAVSNADGTPTNGMGTGQRLLMEDKRALNILDKKFYA